MSTGEKIKAARKRAGLTQKELGAKLNISQSAVGQFENEKSNPNLNTIRKIAEALDISLSELVDDWGRFTQEEILSDWGRDAIDETIQKAFDKLKSIQKDDDSLDDDLFDKNYDSITELSKNASSASKTFYTTQIKKYTKEMYVLLAKLNDTGKEEAIKRVSELTRLSEYMGIDLIKLNLPDPDEVDFQKKDE